MRRRSSPPSTRTRVLHWLGVAVVVAIAVAYVQPISAYLDAREDVAQRRAEKAELVRVQRALRARLEFASTDEFLVREARRLGFVRPGERLFIVSGLEDTERGRLP